MLEKRTTYKEARGKDLNLKKLSRKLCIVLCASFLGTNTQATLPQFEDWSFDEKGNFHTFAGKLIKPWDQPQELKRARKLGPKAVQALINNSVVRLSQFDNGEFVLHLHGRLKGGGGTQSTSSGDGNNDRSDSGGQQFFSHCSVASSSDRFCYTDSTGPVSHPRGGVTISAGPIVRNERYESTVSLDRDRGRDRTETTASGNTITYIDGVEVPNDFLAFAEKYPEAAYRKYQDLKHDHFWRSAKVSEMIIKSIKKDSPPRPSQKKGAVSDKVIKVWQQRGQKKFEKVHVHRPYGVGVNTQGDVGVIDPRRGIVYTVFEGSRKHTDCYLPCGYPVKSADYPARDLQLGQWILSKYGDYKLALNDSLIREEKDLSSAPMRRVLMENRTTKPMEATFGLVLNTMGPDKLYQLGKELSQTNPNSGPAMMEAAQWLYMFRKPEKYFVANMEKPLTSFKGELITHSMIPDHIRAQWHKRPAFTKNTRGTLSIAEPRNGLTYPVYGQAYYGKQADVLLPKGYELKEDHMILGTSFIEAAGGCGQEILQEVLGIPKEAQAGLPAVLAHPATAGACRHLTTKIGGLVASGGLALSTMLDNGEFGKAVLKAAKKGVEGLDHLVEALRGNIKGPSALEQLKRVEEALRAKAAAGNAQEPPSDDESDSDHEERKEDTPEAISKKWIKLKGDQGWKKKSDGTIWKKDKLHKDHWDVSDKKGNKMKEITFDGRRLWPYGPKNKNK